MILKEIIALFDSFAHPAMQESYDNSGLCVGNLNQEVSSALLTIDVTEEIVDEAIEKGIDMIISHHPLVFGGLKSLTGRNYVERCVIKAIKNDIVIYSAHTNFDNSHKGVNKYIGDKIGLSNLSILAPKNDIVNKIVVFIPESHVDIVKDAIFAAGAGTIGNYDCCSFSSEGEGSFRALDGSNPYVGQVGQVHKEKEMRVEFALPKFITSKVVAAIIKAHPYEEVAYDIYELKNSMSTIGSGMVGDLAKPVEVDKFLASIKDIFNVGVIKHTQGNHKTISKVAFCGGSGSFLIQDALRSGADIFLTGDVKYHQFFEPENNMILADIGHFESEQFTNDIFYDILSKKMPKFAVHFSEVSTNPIKYF